MVKKEKLNKVGLDLLVLYLYLFFRGSIDDGKKKQQKNR